MVWNVIFASIGALMWFHELPYTLSCCMACISFGDLCNRCLFNWSWSPSIAVNACLLTTEESSICTVPSSSSASSASSSKKNNKMSCGKRFNQRSKFGNLPYYQQKTKTFKSFWNSQHLSTIIINRGKLEQRFLKISKLVHNPAADQGCSLDNLLGHHPCWIVN